MVPNNRAAPKLCSPVTWHHDNLTVNNLGTAPHPNNCAPPVTQTPPVTGHLKTSPARHCGARGSPPWGVRTGTRPPRRPEAPGSVWGLCPCPPPRRGSTGSVTASRPGGGAPGAGALRARCSPCAMRPRCQSAPVPVLPAPDAPRCRCPPVLTPPGADTPGAPRPAPLRPPRHLPGPPRCCLRRRHRGAAAPCRGGSRCRRPPPAAAMQRVRSVGSRAREGQGGSPGCLWGGGIR